MAAYARMCSAQRIVEMVALALLFRRRMARRPRQGSPDQLCGRALLIVVEGKRGDSFGWLAESQLASLAGDPKSWLLLRTGGNSKSRSGSLASQPWTA